MEISPAILIPATGLVFSVIGFLISNFLKLRKARKDYVKEVSDKIAEEIALRETLKSKITAVEVEIERLKEDFSELKVSSNLEQQAVWKRFDKVDSKLDEMIKMIVGLNEKK